jgi:hypothetical protein
MAAYTVNVVCHTLPPWSSLLKADVYIKMYAVRVYALIQSQCPSRQSIAPTTNVLPPGVTRKLSQLEVRARNTLVLPEVVLEFVCPAGMGIANDMYTGRHVRMIASPTRLRGPGELDAR